jgi:hypothetical protein
MELGGNQSPGTLSIRTAPAADMRSGGGGGVNFRLWHGLIINFMERRHGLLCLQQPHPEPDESNPHTPTIAPIFAHVFKVVSSL